MSLFGGAPKPQPSITPVVPQLPDTSVQNAGADTARQAAAAANNSTILTGAMGTTTQANKSYKNLLGQ